MTILKIDTNDVAQCIRELTKLREGEQVLDKLATITRLSNHFSWLSQFGFDPMEFYDACFDTHADEL